MVVRERPVWVEFVYAEEFKRGVNIHGEWNSYQAMPMATEELGKKVIASVTMFIPPGEYRYYFVADGKRVVSGKHPQREYENGRFNIRNVRSRSSMERTSRGLQQSRPTSTTNRYGEEPRHTELFLARKQRMVASFCEPPSALNEDSMKHSSSPGSATFLIKRNPSSSQLAGANIAAPVHFSSSETHGRNCESFSRLSKRNSPAALRPTATSQSRSPPTSRAKSQKPATQQGSAPPGLRSTKGAAQSPQQQKGFGKALLQRLSWRQRSARAAQPVAV
mmetsp:Transcript_2661/g.8027  ORF Transcript_2661/g.8027 Transcript_2661/m.8027 type:complete len:277 (+) Transcript_2661:189-1019(+)